MARGKVPPFVQVSAAVAIGPDHEQDDMLVGLDKDGRVWLYHVAVGHAGLAGPYWERLSDVAIHPEPAEKA